MSEYVGQLTLPDHFLGDAVQRKMVTQLLNARLPHPVDLEWQMTKSPMRVVFRRAAEIPDIVPLKQWAEYIEKLPLGSILIGCGVGNKPYVTSLRSEEPHWGMIAKTRRGKSTFLCISIAQIFHQDPLATAVGIDVKRESFTALLGVPGFTLYNDPRNIGEMWEAIKAFRKMMDDRCSAHENDPTMEFPHAIIAIDEVSQFSAQCQEHWQAIRKKGDRARPPVWNDIAAILWQGAAFRCHVIIAGQRLDDATTGGLGLNVSFGFKGLGGHHPNDWMRLVGSTPVPLSQKGRGRWIFNDGEDNFRLQNLFAEPPAIKDWALSNRTLVNDPDPWVVGLAAGAELLGITVDALRKRREKHGPLPGEGRRGNRPMWKTSALKNLDPEKLGV